MNVKDKVYKVIRNHTTGRLAIEEFQILRVMRYGRLICFRTDGSDFSRGQHSFQPHQVGSTPEEAKKKYEEYLFKRLKQLEKEIITIQKDLEELC